MLDVVMRESMMLVEKVCCDAFSGSIMWVLFIYL